MQRFRPSRGFTMIEMILVLVVFGLLLGGVLKTTEMINGAKVKALSDRVASIEYAWYTFIDRYGARPTKVRNIRGYLPGVRHESSPFKDSDIRDVDHRVHLSASPAVFHQLKVAGLLKCDACTKDDGGASGSFGMLENSPNNGFGGVMSIWNAGPLSSNSGVYNAFYARTPDERLQDQVVLFTGAAIPSNVLAEFDRKKDDGAPHKGRVRFTPWWVGSWGSITDLVLNCLNERADGHRNGQPAGYVRPVLYWRPMASEPPVYGNCSGAVLL